jgi:class 3 adenylate cyclase
MHWRVNTVGKWLDGNFYNLVMLAATIWALFLQDIADLALNKSVDPGFGGINAFVFFLFVLDLILGSIGKPGYFPSLFFFLDLLATVSILPDVPFIWNPFLNAVGGGGDGGGAAAATQQASIARTGRAARAGTRAGRLVRLFKVLAHYRKDKNGPKTELEETSVVGKKLSELTIRKVIIGVMLMVSIVPLLNAEAPDSAYVNGLKAVDDLAEWTLRRSSPWIFANVTAGTPPPSADPTSNRTGTWTALEAELAAATYNLKYPTYKTIPPADLLMQDPDFTFALRNYLRFRNDVLTLRVWGVQVVPAGGPDLGLDPWDSFLGAYRTSELRQYSNSSAILLYSANSGGTLVANSRTRVARPLTLAIYNFKSYNQRAAMFNIILTVFVVVLLSVGAGLFARDANTLMIAPIERMVRVVKALAEDPLARLEENKDDGPTNFETSLVEAALRKIGTLLQIGFGEAGAEIIGKNLSSGGSVNPMLPGVRINGVYGFCDIRNFTDATECLQEDVMVFVNVIAEIVHFAVKRNGGSPNKNIGDAFLVVFKTPQDLSEPKHFHEGKQVSVQKKEELLADGALRSFLDIISEINANEKLKEFAKHPAIQARLGPTYSVKLGFGLHYGWSIEGAIGSALKIDASYLSPHVNLSGMLESSTKGYGVPLLLSGTFYNNLSKKMKAQCRKVDRVIVPATKDIFDLFCVDIDPPAKSATFPGIKRYTKQFEAGIAAYVSGNWAAAVAVFQKCLELWPQDDCARSILWYLSRYNFRAPTGPDPWLGYRELKG